jgi:hypothetical protein
LQFKERTTRCRCAGGWLGLVCIILATSQWEHRLVLESTKEGLVHLDKGCDMAASKEHEFQ